MGASAEVPRTGITLHKPAAVKHPPSNKYTLTALLIIQQLLLN
jgi:hypothetical protein